MSGNLAPLPIFQFFDQNGDPLSGGSIEWLAAGTQSRVSVFADNALQVALPNPTPLDAAGRPRTGSGPTTIWFDAGRAYKAIHRDEQGRILWTADNLVSPGTGAPGPPGADGKPGHILGSVTYETGDFTPTIATNNAGPGSGQVYNVQIGLWTRIGRLVVVSGKVGLSTVGTFPSGAQLLIGGLPFLVSTEKGDDAGTYGGLILPLYERLKHPWSSLHGLAQNNPNGYSLWGSSTEHLVNTNVLEFTADDIDNGFYCAFAGHFLIDEPDTGGTPTISIGGEQILVGDGTTNVALTAGFAVHVVVCQNVVAPMELFTVTMSGGTPQAGERLSIISESSTGQACYLNDSGVVTAGPASLVNDVRSARSAIVWGSAEYVWVPAWGPGGGWRMVAHRQHTPIDTPFDPATYRANEPQFNTWTVTAGNILRQRYEVVGNKVRLWLQLINTEFTGFAGELYIGSLVWGGFTAGIPTQNAGIVTIGCGDTINDWDHIDHSIGYALVHPDDNALLIQNLTGEFHGPNITINASLEFEVL